MRTGRPSACDQARQVAAEQLVLQGLGRGATAAPARRSAAPAPGTRRSCRRRCRPRPPARRRARWCAPPPAPCRSGRCAARNCSAARESTPPGANASRPTFRSLPASAPLRGGSTRAGHQAGSLGSSTSSRRAIWSRSARRRFFSRRIMSSSTGDFARRHGRSWRPDRHAPCAARSGGVGGVKVGVQVHLRALDAGCGRVRSIIRVSVQ